VWSPPLSHKMVFAVIVMCLLSQPFQPREIRLNTNTNVSIFRCLQTKVLEIVYLS
jgi:hypothetical protein